MAAPPQILSVFSGIGMLDEAIRLVFRDAITLCYIEREAYCAAVLATRMEEGSLDEAPVWSDIGTFNANGLRGRIDILVGGPPCQPYSVAGKRVGNADKRSFGDGTGPLHHLLRIISECRPTLVFLENVPAWVCGGWFRQFGEALCGLGCEIEEPVLLTAAAVRAGHKRERVFILAHQTHKTTLGNSECWGLGQGDSGDKTTSAEIVASRCDSPIFAPGPNDPAWEDILEDYPHLAPAIEPGLRLLVDGRPVVLDASRANQLRAAGNGVVALQAGLAFAHLLERMK